MDEQKTTGTLYIVATPIGNSRDMSERGREILSTADIRAIFCNGKTSWNYYRKYQEAVTGIPAVSLPSTSPANAAWSLEKLKGAWNVILPYIR